MEQVVIAQPTAKFAIASRWQQATPFVRLLGLSKLRSSMWLHSFPWHFACVTHVPGRASMKLALLHLSFTHHSETVGHGRSHISGHEPTSRGLDGSARGCCFEEAVNGRLPR